MRYPSARKMNFKLYISELRPCRNQTWAAFVELLRKGFNPEENELLALKAINRQ
ncbi:hypothetical protein PhaeoP23_03985 (plasmid) [Phaeobacter piscinae]|uniref:Transposase n=1 Tax=Phaeobacter piscinae TaxID=1580596 RepID=A0ABN5DW57_9RHOB|nr:hypothetical protein PhaeoP36_04063 [Phaeobacter piscinae]AUQ88659.1 hypothetical protein PhaeoP42_04064 [Phaeobacter piscinae]AUQ92658.1 hypothetical protein PhaeoP24_04100 [Phaeobacter inhibens]AUR26464.1 hypothetical protein PhaeoP23_03985 [Phaeobacter piscinae]